MPRHATKTTFKKGQKFLLNGKPMGREKGCVPWNRDIKQWENKVHPNLGKTFPSISKKKKKWWESRIDNYYTTTICLHCGKSFKHLKLKNRKFCSKSCSSLHIPKEIHKLRAKKAAITSKRNGNYLETSKRMKEGGALRALKGNIKFPRISKPQLKLFAMIKSKYRDAELEYEVGGRSIDIAIPSLKVAVEYDGEYWHQNKIKDIRRDKELDNLGWYTIRINKEILKVLERFNEPILEV